MSAINSAIRSIESGLVTVRQISQALGTNSSLLEVRRSFTQDLVNTLGAGAADLVNADLNEESTNLFSLQTRQQLGVIQLSVGGGVVSFLQRLI